MINKKLILASASPRRRFLLSQLGIDFTVEPSTEEENIDTSTQPHILAADLAESKAMNVAMRHKDSLVLGADTIVAIDGRILGKPKDSKQAAEMLSLLSGRWHYVYTGLALIDTESGKQIKDYEESRVRFKNLTSREIKNYINTGEPFDKAGAYGIQGKGSLFIEKIEGCYYNIVGLPLFKLNTMLLKFGIELL
ncbi:MAG: nucleoside triphosphate pyrophosphatase [Tepidanaerobacteraceae bacterium]|nr:nucleoside triphosphate pyrophosphatase [Tepidanaerobacteraceae bacterium]